MSAARDRLVAAIEEIIAAMSDVESAFDPTDQEEVLAVYGMIADVLNVAKDCQSVVGTAAIAVVPDRFEAYQVPGGGLFKIAGGRERKRYDQARLVSAAAAAIIDHLGIVATVSDTGEVSDTAEPVERAIREFAAFTGCTTPSFDGWRSGAAKAHGLKLNDFADLETSPITHRIEGRSRI